MPLVYEKSPTHSEPAEEVSIGLDFYFQTANLRKVSQGDFAHIHKKNRSSEWRNGLAHHCKRYQFSETLSLLPFLSKENAQPSFAEVIYNRHSEREFTGAPITLQQLASTLHMAYSTRQRSLQFPGGKTNPIARTAPSGGACFPIELYLTVLNVHGLNPGLYHYNPVDFTLEKVADGQLTNQMAQLYEAEAETIQKCSVLITLTGLYERTVQQKYKSRGWRLLFLDAGHVGENIWLSSEANQIGCVALAGGWDFEIMDYLKVSKSDELYLLSYALGQPCKK